MSKYPQGFSKEDIADSEQLLKEVQSATASRSLRNKFFKRLPPFDTTIWDQYSDIQITEEDLTAPRPNKWRCSTVGCTYCDPDNYDGWDDEATARQQVDYDYLQCSIAKSDYDNNTTTLCNVKLP